MSSSSYKEFFKYDLVEKISGDYQYRGTVISIVVKLGGKIRYVVENKEGLLFIFNGSQLRKQGEESKKKPQVLYNLLDPIIEEEE